MLIGFTVDLSIIPMPALLELVMESSYDAINPVGKLRSTWENLYLHSLWEEQLFSA